MENGNIRCPKCTHEQDGGTECEVCGVIFARYQQILARKAKALEEQRARQEELAQKSKGAGKGPLIAITVLMLVVLTAGATYYLVRPDSPTPSGEQLANVVPEQKITEAEQKLPVPAAAESSRNSENQSNSAPGQDTRQLRASGGTIEQARRATVSIETPWGTGSGFFINDNYIVTNRHVIELDQNQLAEFRRKVEATRDLVELEKKKLGDYRAEMKRLPQGATRSQLAIIIKESERELNKVLPRLQEAEERLSRMEDSLLPSDIKIILADGASHSANYLMVSEKHDLAIMSLYVKDTPYLKRAPKNVPIQQGDKVFTIGSPVGLRNTVTSGVFSGYRKDGASGKVFLQTDAPINPGNSGGPLIDERGYVHGVNTMIIKDTEGIGFAIPIATVFEEFGSSIY
ncbi:S1C family serine protease [Desulfosediminicola ganghwensis]|uniref:S1C family serine protease n=1 Tax=Desulfosediminicola ganghwensis TaxID=2569540 RepID=UPI0010AC4D06|nr:trypsin-like peptidase domain-containing protein [Desulfosediminicola ganghwensis]